VVIETDTFFGRVSVSFLIVSSVESHKVVSPAYKAKAGRIR